MHEAIHGWSIKELGIYNGVCTLGMNNPRVSSLNLSFEYW